MIRRWFDSSSAFGRIMIRPGHDGGTREAHSFRGIADGDAVSDWGNRLREFLLGGAVAALCGCASAPVDPAPTQAHAQSVQTNAFAQPQLVRFEHTARLTPGQAVVIDNPYGDVRLRFGGYDEQLELQSVAQQPEGADAIALQPGEEAGSYRIAPRLPAGRLLADKQRLDLAVFVPLGHAVQVRTEFGNIESRSIRGNLDLRSTRGNIALRGTHGRVLAETGAGSIEASLLTAPAGSQQRLSTTTGSIIVAVADQFDARVEMATSALFATEFSLQVQELPGQEPNKRATTLVGADKSTLSLHSRRGEIRLLRWRDFSTPESVSEHEKTESKH